MTLLPYGYEDSESVIGRSSIIPDSNDQAYASRWRTRITGSFSHLMASICQDPPPAAYGFTVFSAIPVADAVRGFHEALGQPCPTLIPIPRPIKPSARYHTERVAPLKEQEDKLRGEVGDRLRELSSIAIIDQLVNHGKTVRAAVELCKTSGVTRVMASRTRWYGDGYQTEDPTTFPDIENMTSPYSEIMLEIGRTTAKVVDTVGPELLKTTVDVA